MDLGNVKILILGAGGLGCEIVKTLAFYGLPELHIVDLDTIELTNLNRQFLFRIEDIGQPKAIVAANTINKFRIPCAGHREWVKVVPYYQDLTLFSDEFISQFDVIISGLDSIEARRWINHKLHQLASSSNFKTVIPLIDGATEGLMGNCKLIVPGFTACYECSLTTLPNYSTTFPLCTLASNPRTLEHCIQYASIIQWPRHFDRPHDLESELDIRWLYSKSLERAQEFDIEYEDKLSPRYVLGVLKNIIPSVTTTNAIIAGQCCKHAMDLLQDNIDIETCPTFTMFNGESGVSLFSYRHERDPMCPICSILN